MGHQKSCFSMDALKFFSLSFLFNGKYLFYSSSKISDQPLFLLLFDSLQLLSFFNLDHSQSINIYCLSRKTSCSQVCKPGSLSFSDLFFPLIFFPDFSNLLQPQPSILLVTKSIITDNKRPVYQMHLYTRS